MHNNITIKINSLAIVALVLSSLLLLPSCQLFSPAAAPEPIPASSIDINHQSALQIVNSQTWDYFTEFGSPYSCRLSLIEPKQNEPNWLQPDNVWQRIRLGYQLDWNMDQQRIDAEFNWYHKNPSYMARVSQRAERYIYHVTEQLEQRGLPLELALLPIVESAYDPFAYSHGRASGMWQFIPATGRMYKLHQNWWYDGRRDISASTTAAINYLDRLNRYYKGDWLLALAAYNSGIGNVNKAIRKNKKRGKPTDFWSLDLPRETRSYVPKLLALAKLVDNPRRYGIELHPVANSPYFTTVDTKSQIDLAQAAAMAEVDIDEIYRLNPGFNQWATSPTGPHQLLIPASQKTIFEQNFADSDPRQRLHWQRYRVKSGDSLGYIAHRFSTSIDTIKEINKIRGNMIRAGQSLMIPTAAEAGGHYSLSAEQRLANIHKKRTGGSNSKQQFHSVREGDSLWTISRRYNVKVSQLAHWNGIAPKDTLRPGQKLSVWTTDTSQIKIGQREGVVKKVGYKVRNGDSLAGIANRFNVRVSDIVKWNTVNPQKYIQPGQRLTLFVDVTNYIN